MAGHQGVGPLRPRAMRSSWGRSDVSAPPLDAKTHVYRSGGEGSIPGERAIVSALGRGLLALDVGCGASGRSTRMLRSLGANVFPCDINLEALQELSRGAPDLGAGRLIAADMLDLPFPAGTFDLALVAKCGLDYIAAESRVAALVELERVVRPGGHLVFSSLNTVGVLLSPRGLRSARYWKWRLRYLTSGSFARGRLVDINGLDMAHALPRRVIEQVTRNTAFRLEFATDRLAWTRNLWLLTCFSDWPYYLFVKAPARA